MATSTFSGAKQAIVGIATLLALVGIMALVLAMVAPNFVNSFAANATPVVTGQTSLVSQVIAEGGGSVGAGAGIPQ